MSRPRTCTRTVLFAETFDFPTPPTWDRQSILEARRIVSQSYSPGPASSLAPPPEPYSLEPVDSWQAVQHAASIDHVRPITPLRLPPKPASRRPSIMLYPENKPLPAYPVPSQRSGVIPEETSCRGLEPWSAPRQHQRQPSSDFEDECREDHQQQHQVRPQHQWPWSHAHAPSPDCPCCSSHFTSRWSICSDESRPPSPNSSIHQRLRKMASSSTLRSVRSSIRLRLKASILQLTRRH